MWVRSRWGQLLILRPASTGFAAAAAGKYDRYVLFTFNKAQDDKIPRREYFDKKESCARIDPQTRMSFYMVFLGRRDLRRSSVVEEHKKFVLRSNCNVGS